MWNSIPQDVQTFIISLAANIAAKFYPKKKDKEPLQAGLEEGFKYFVTQLGDKYYASMENLLGDADVKDFFIDKIWEEESSEDIERLKDIIYKNQINIDISTLDDIEMSGAIRSFLRGFHLKMGNYGEPALRAIKAKLSELTEMQRIALEEKESRKLDLKALQEAYFTYIKEQYAILGLEGFGEKEPLPVPLNKVYTDIIFSHDHAALGKSEKEKEDTYLQDDLKKSGQPKSATLSDIMHCQYSIITGGPGAGKSTFLKHIATECIKKIEKGASGDLPIPVIFPIAAFAERLKDEHSYRYTLRDFLFEYFEGKVFCDLSTLFLKEWGRGNAIFLVDGLDEVADETERKKVSEAVRDFIIADKSLGNKYIITCRTASYTNVVQLKPVSGREFIRFSVQPFDIPQIDAFLFKWYNWYEKEIKGKAKTYKAEAKQSRDNMLNIIQGDKNIFSIATNPLLLTMLMLVEYEGGELPKGRADLYSKCLNMLANRWEKLRSLHIKKKKENFSLGDRPIDSEMLVRFLGPVAWGMLESGLPEIDYANLKSMFAEELNKRNKDMVISKQQADDFIGILKERSGILQEVSTASYGFVHQTFKEYLAARVLTDLADDRIEKIGSRLFFPEWQEVVLLAVASLKLNVATRFVRDIMDRESEHFENLLLAGECIIDAGRDKISDELFDDLFAALEKLAYGDFPIKNRADAGEVLGRLGDKRDLEPFIKIPGGSYLVGGREKEIKPFQISKFPVTNIWFEKFIKDKGYKNLDIWSDQGNKLLRHTKAKQPVLWNDRRWNCPNFPVVGVCWYEADAFCRWLTIKRNDQYVYSLPDEDQWEAAAAGFDQRKYPWKGEWENGVCNTSESNIGRTSAVGIFTEGETPEGIADMVGNVWEWTLCDYETKEKLDDFLFDKDYKKMNQRPAIRGGSWYYDRGYARCAFRYWSNPYYRFTTIGFRCVRTLK